MARDSPLSSDIGQNSDGVISDFRISGQSFIKENCHNSRTSDDIDMKLRPVTKLDKKNKTTSKKLDDDVMLENCDVIVIFPIYAQFGAIRKSDSGRTACKTYTFDSGNLLSYKNWKQNYKIFNTTLTLLLWVKVLFFPKNAEFLQKNADISKVKRALVLKGIFSETTYVCVLMYQISRF